MEHRGHRSKWFTLSLSSDTTTTKLCYCCAFLIRFSRAWLLEAVFEYLFTDFVLSIGPTVAEVSSEFDQYWNSEHAFPITTLNPKVEVLSLEQLRKKFDDFYKQKTTTAYVDALTNSPLAIALKNNTADFSFAKAIVIHDSSKKLDKKGDWKDQLLITQLAPYIKEAKEELPVLDLK